MSMLAEPGSPPRKVGLSQRATGRPSLTEARAGSPCLQGGLGTRTPEMGPTCRQQVVLKSGVASRPGSQRSSLQPVQATATQVPREAEVLVGVGGWGLGGSSRRGG